MAMLPERKGTAPPLPSTAVRRSAKLIDGVAPKEVLVQPIGELLAL